MQKVFMKYNPHQVRTQVLLDGKESKRNSRLHFGERRLQEWIDDLPDILLEECGTREFELTSHGTVPDYEDIVAMAREAAARNIRIAFKHIPAKDIKDKEAQIGEIFKSIQEGPFKN